MGRERHTHHRVITVWPPPVPTSYLAKVNKCLLYLVCTRSKSDTLCLTFTPSYVLYCMYLRPDRIQFVLQTDFLYLAAFSRFIHLCFTDSSIIVCSTWLSFMSLSYLFIGIIYTVQFCLTQRFTKTKRYFKQLPDSGSQMVTFRKFNLP